MEIWKFWKRISVDKIECCGGGKPSWLIRVRLVIESWAELRIEACRHGKKSEGTATK